MAACTTLACAHVRHAIVTALLEAVQSNLALMVPVTDTLVTLNLNAPLLVRTGLGRQRAGFRADRCGRTQAEARGAVLERLASIDLSDLPVVIGFLLQSVTPETTPAVLTALRLSLNVETFAAVEASTRGRGKAAATAEDRRRTADSLILGRCTQSGRSSLSAADARRGARCTRCAADRPAPAPLCARRVAAGRPGCRDRGTGCFPLCPLQRGRLMRDRVMALVWMVRAPGRPARGGHAGAADAVCGAGGAQACRHAPSPQDPGWPALPHAGHPHGPRPRRGLARVRPVTVVRGGGACGRAHTARACTGTSSRS
jgi:hypothetical protein